MTKSAASSSGHLPPRSRAIAFAARVQSGHVGTVEMLTLYVAAILVAILSYSVVFVPIVWIFS